MERIDRGGELPQRDSLNYKRFIRAWREWYKQACTTEDEETQKRNLHYYAIGKKHLEGLGINITEIPTTGSLQVNTPKAFGHPDDNNAERAFSYEVA